MFGSAAGERPFLPALGTANQTLALEISTHCQVMSEMTTPKPLHSQRNSSVDAVKIPGETEQRVSHFRGSKGMNGGFKMEAARVGAVGATSGTYLCAAHSCQWCPCLPDPQGPLARKEKGGKKNVLVDVTRRGGSGGWTAGRSDEDRCLLIPSTPTEFVFHRVLAEVAV